MLSSPIYELRRPAALKLPLIISAPHVGTDLPDEVRAQLQPKLARDLPDTDWFVHQLYDFSEEIGAILIRARFSRYVVDLNRPTSGPALYTDSRRQTDVLPLTSFSGEELYAVGGRPDAKERERRIQLYHVPYYEALKQLLLEVKAQFGQALLFDAHSIARSVPSIRAQLFPDMIVGDRDGQSAKGEISAILRNTLQAEGFDVSYNEPFKGGEITRHHGRPADGVHAVQLEMSQDVYMHEGQLDSQKISHLKPVLRKALCAMAAKVK